MAETVYTLDPELKRVEDFEDRDEKVCRAKDMGILTQMGTYIF